MFDPAFMAEYGATSVTQVHSPPPSPPPPSAANADIVPGQLYQTFSSPPPPTSTTTSSSPPPLSISSSSAGSSPPTGIIAATAVIGLVVIAAALSAAAYVSRARKRKAEAAIESAALAATTASGGGDGQQDSSLVGRVSLAGGGQSPRDTLNEDLGPSLTAATSAASRYGALVDCEDSELGTGAEKASAQIRTPMLAEIYGIKLPGGGRLSATPAGDTFRTESGGRGSSSRRLQPEDIVFEEHDDVENEEGGAAAMGSGRPSSSSRSLLVRVTSGGGGRSSRRVFPSDSGVPPLHPGAPGGGVVGAASSHSSRRVLPSDSGVPPARVSSLGSEAAAATGGSESRGRWADSVPLPTAAARGQRPYSSSGALMKEALVDVSMDDDEFGSAVRDASTAGDRRLMHQSSEGPRVRPEGLHPAASSALRPIKAASFAARRGPSESGIPAPRNNLLPPIVMRPPLAATAAASAGYHPPVMSGPLPPRRPTSGSGWSGAGGFPSIPDHRDSSGTPWSAAEGSFLRAATRSSSLSRSAAATRLVPDPDVVEESGTCSGPPSVSGAAGDDSISAVSVTSGPFARLSASGVRPPILEVLDAQDVGISAQDKNNAGVADDADFAARSACFPSFVSGGGTPPALGRGSQSFRHQEVANERGARSNSELMMDSPAAGPSDADKDSVMMPWLVLGSPTAGTPRQRKVSKKPAGQRAWD